MTKIKLMKKKNRDAIEGLKKQDFLQEKVYFDDKTKKIKAVALYFCPLWKFLENVPPTFQQMLQTTTAYSKTRSNDIKNNNLYNYEQLIYLTEEIRAIYSAQKNKNEIVLLHNQTQIDAKKEKLVSLKDEVSELDSEIEKVKKNSI